MPNFLTTLRTIFPVAKDNLIWVYYHLKIRPKTSIKMTATISNIITKLVESNLRLPPNQCPFQHYLPELLLPVSCWAVRHRSDWPMLMQKQVQERLLVPTP